MYKLKETGKKVKVVFDQCDDLRDAPAPKFSRKSHVTIENARKHASRYAKGMVGLYSHTKNLSSVIRQVPQLNKDKINFHVDNIKNKTGVVGVYLEYKYHNGVRDEEAYAYTSNYVVNGERVVTRFPIKNFKSKEAAYFAAVANRLLALNLSRDVLQQIV